MKLSEALHFDENNYQRAIAEKHFSYTTLAKEIYRKRANKTASKTRLAMSIIAIPVTSGMSLMSTATNSRNISVESRKLKWLELEWARRGQTRLPEQTTRDKLISISIAIGASIIIIGIDAGLSGIAPIPDVIPCATPVFDLNGHLISEALCTIQQVGLAYLNDVLDDKVEEVGDNLISKVVSRDLASAQPTPNKDPAR